MVRKRGVGLDQRKRPSAINRSSNVKFELRLSLYRHLPSPPHLCRLGSSMKVGKIANKECTSTAQFWRAGTAYITSLQKAETPRHAFEPAVGRVLVNMHKYARQMGRRAVILILCANERPSRRADGTIVLPSFLRTKRYPLRPRRQAGWAGLSGIVLDVAPKISRSLGGRLMA